MAREMETWLSDSRVGNSGVVDHGSRRPVLSPLRNRVDRMLIRSHTLPVKCYHRLAAVMTTSAQCLIWHLLISGFDMVMWLFDPCLGLIQVGSKWQH